MNALIKLTSSSIGKKWVVALTGLAMLLFVIGHLLGNLQIFVGPEAINNYGVLLRTSPELLWVIRLVLLAMVGLHVVFTLWLIAENRRARPEQYAYKASVQLKPSQRYMAVTGLLLLGFIFFHLMHFTLQNVNPAYATFHDEKGRHDVYRMVVEGFSNPWTSIFYAVAMGLLCSHLSHGAWSWMQTVGLRTKKLESVNHGARILAVVLAAGYISIPASVLLGGLGKDYVAGRVREEQAARLSTPTTPQAAPQPAHSSK